MNDVERICIRKLLGLVLTIKLQEEQIETLKKDRELDHKRISEVLNYL